MGLNFVTSLPQDGVQPRSGHTETARELRANPTSEGWADITKDGGYSKRATATAAAKEINDHTHPAYRDYGFEATVRSVNVTDASGAQVYEHDAKTDKNVPKQVHTLYARYNPTLPNAGTLAPEVVKKAKKAAVTETADAAPSAPETDAQPSAGTSAPASDESPAPATVAAPAAPSGRKPAAAKR